MIRTLLLATTLATALAACAAPAARDGDAPVATSDDAAAVDAALAAAIAGDWRDAKARARDTHRHPLETLRFFGVAPGHTVIEITPGGGWYADILAPYLRGSGRYVAAVVDPQSQEARRRDYYQKSRTELEQKFAAAPGRFDRATVVAFDTKAPGFGAPASADVVLTFRNVHNWRGAGYAAQMFQGFHEVLKPGGVLGVVEHRADRDLPDDDRSGYVGEQQVIAMATAAGFVLDGKSEINANPRDTKDHAKGVWTLPPSNDHDAEDKARYEAIGESDRMTLRFVKPAR